MNDDKISLERTKLLADVASSYYLEGKNQEEIAAAVGVTRSMISRMLTEARKLGIVEIRIHRPLCFDATLETALKERYGLQTARVLEVRSAEDPHALAYLGKAGAEVLKEVLKPDMTLGIAWGTSISAVVDEIELDAVLPIKIVQLVGAPGAHIREYDGHALVARLAQKLGGESYFLNAPFVCPNAETARSVLSAPGIAETVAMGKQSDLALVGVGSTAPRYSSFYLAGYVPRPELDQLLAAGAVGDVCGIHFDGDGNPVGGEFGDRLVTIQRSDLLAIPIRIGVASGPGKVDPIVGALRGGYINALITDNFTAKQVLDRSGTLEPARDGHARKL
jgi:DNA-binding transcriptional regulator LsrR (DeoR family)